VRPYSSTDIFAVADCPGGRRRLVVAEPAAATVRPSLELEIEPGTTPRGVAQNVVKAGVQTDARLLYAWFRLCKDRAIKAGNYELSTRAHALCCCKSWRAARKACAR
jgi:cell division protein YceG involved in septum cleavage